jgi:hypothetical protein
VPELVPETPVLPTQIVPAPALAEKMRKVADNNVQQRSGSGKPLETIAIPPGHEHDLTITTSDKPERAGKSKVGAMEELQDQGQGIRGGT